MGSSSDWETLKVATDRILTEFGRALRREARGLGAPHARRDVRLRRRAAGRGLRAIIAGAGGAAHLPGMLAAKTVVPVLGVPVASRHLQGVDSLHSIVQMPKGIPVATFAIGTAGRPMRRCSRWPCWLGDDAGLREQLTPSGPARPRRRAP
jgi:5-(carboxyamino)imidazole ribonucleotide mutase